MKTDQKKAPPEAEIDALEIKLERIPADNLAEVTATLWTASESPPKSCSAR